VFYNAVCRGFDLIKVWQSEENARSLCPNEDCSDRLPSNPSQKLTEMLHDHRLLGATSGRTGGKYLRSELEVCYQITTENSRETEVAYARSRNWPIEIDFESLPGRIVAMKNDLVLMVADKNTRANTIVHQRLLTNISQLGLGTGFQKLAKRTVMPMDVICYARPG
jgi:hypothetical protein